MPRFALLPFACVCLVALGCGPKPTDPAPPPPPTDPAPPATPAAPPAATLRGSVVHPGKPGQKLTVGYVELGGGDWVGDVVWHTIPAAGESARVDSDAFPPRKATLSFDKGVTFEFTNLPPGPYFAFARLDNGPAAWAKLDLKAGAPLAHEFKLDAGKGGTVEVTTPADFSGDVRLAPNEHIPADDAKFVGGKIASQLELGAKAKDGKVTITDVPPGKYTLFAIPGTLAPRGTVDVTAGKTATVELEKERK